jgi:hypothetical protein
MANVSKASRATRVKLSRSPRSNPVPRPKSASRSTTGTRSKNWQSSLRTQTWVTTCALLAIPPMVIAHVTGAATVNPLTAPISDYAWIPGGYLMVWFSASLLAGCGAIVAHRVHRAVRLWPELRRPLRWVMGLLISFTVGLFVSGVLPTDLPEAVSPTVSSMIHRIGAGWALLALPAAGLVLAKAAAEVVLPGHAARLLTIARWLLYGVLAALVVHFTLFLIFGSGLPGFGLFERIGFGVLIQHMILLGYAFGNQSAAELNAASAAAEERLMSTDGGLVEIAGAVSCGEHRGDLTEHFAERFDPVRDQIGDTRGVLDHAADDQAVAGPRRPPITGPQGR